MLIFQTTLKWKAALLNKRRERAKPVLSDDDVQLLVKNTYFSEHDIRSVILRLFKQKHFLYFKKKKEELLSFSQNTEFSRRNCFLTVLNN